MSKLPTTGRNTILIPIDLIKIGDRARIDKGDIPYLAERIKEKGLIQPITINQDYKLLAGERRILAHKELGRDTIEAIVRPTKDKIDMMEIELIENIARKDMTWQEIAQHEKRLFDEKSKAGNWNQRQQAEMLKQSQFTTSRNIQMAEALEMLPELAELENFDQAWKELKKLEEGITSDILAQKVPGSVRQASKWAKDHYHVGDAFTGMAGCNKNIVNFAEIDPPYAVDLDKRKSRNKGKTMEEYNEVDPDEYIHFYEKTAKEVFRILRADSFAVFWFGWDWYGDVRDIIKGAGFKIPTIPAIWNKGGVGQTASPDTTLGSCHEPFWLARKGAPKLKRPGRGNVFDFQPVSSARKIHPTERPLGLMEEILNTCLWPGSTVLIPFLGSGSTLRAAYACGHTGFGWDLSEENKKRFLKKVAEDKGEEPEPGKPDLAAMADAMEAAGK